ncbi:MAG: hypothetical protein N3A68_07255 [Bacteroidia bacterium]|jgi:hypothetical protein|nr:hypothetical protein [Bacteroidia bacterium]GIV22365.1 MAG: hypothetical protein KatS3mg025_0024 [Bacteroidia bacterium]
MWAYIEPGSGLLLLQAIIAGMAAAWLFLKRKGISFLTALGLKKRTPSKEPQPADNSRE